MRLVIAIICLFALSGCLTPKHPYDTVDKTWWGYMAGGQAYDAYTSIEAQKRGGIEMNDIIYGSHPSSGKIVAIKAATIIVVTLIGNQMKPTPRKWAYAFGGTLGFAAGLHNSSVNN